MPAHLVADTKACKHCTIGSCCYEGTELTKAELIRVVKFKPAVAKPWFRRVESREQSDPDHVFSTIIRNGTCVFQGKDNRCMIYPVRPLFCREFPLENEGAAPYYQRLCVLFHEEWPARSDLKRNLLKRESHRLKREATLPGKYRPTR